ncbi:MAG: shikimate dehydrogenase [Bacteroidetes bacterium]|nr:shikimate dehydrogenase [Bacteroidota bacterium]
MQFGLIGKKLSHSFSKKYFEEKFGTLGLNNYSYNNFELENIKEFPSLIQNNPELSGLNVTVPYKEGVMPFLNEISEEAKAIGAVNCIKITNGKTKGYNTDEFGFRFSIKPFLEPKHNRALIFGTGGSSKAVAYALKSIGVEYYFVTSSNSKKTRNTFFYSELNPVILKQFLLLVNCTPVGMFPNIYEAPAIPYEQVTANHLAYDLIYNPQETLFLKKCREQGATTINGLSMLKLQAEKSWEIWNEK